MKSVVGAAVWMVAGCSSVSSSSSNGSPADAYVPPQPSCVWINTTYRENAKCHAGAASTLIEMRSNGMTSHSMCYEVAAQDAATCTAGCSIDSALTNDWRMPPLELYFLGHAAKVMCAETPDARAGDPCDLTGMQPCWPTRARLAADGTVAGQDYLQCVQGSCAAAPPPGTWQVPVATCAVPADYPPATTGFVSDGVQACLIAWDQAAQTFVTGQTRVCIGDWQCPAGALCDDQLIRSPALEHVAVCKPGPRGTLTPAMLR